MWIVLDGGLVQKMSAENKILFSVDVFCRHFHIKKICTAQLYPWYIARLTVAPFGCWYCSSELPLCDCTENSVTYENPRSPPLLLMCVRTIGWVKSRRMCGPDSMDWSLHHSSSPVWTRSLAGSSSSSEDALMDASGRRVRSLDKAWNPFGQADTYTCSVSSNSTWWNN